MSSAIPAVIAGGAVVMAAIVALFGVLYGHLSRRINELQADLGHAHSYNRKMWAYCRYLLDLYYRHREHGAPDPDPLPDDPDSGDS